MSEGSQAERLRRILRWLAPAIVVTLLALVFRRMDFGRVWNELGTLRLGWLLGALLYDAAILPLWALQWHLLAPADAGRPIARMVVVVAITSTVLNTTPLLVGEATGVVLLVALAGLTRAAALSVLAMDQLLVGVAKLVVLAFAAVLLSLPRWMSGAIAPLVTGVAVLLIILSLAAWRHVDLARWSERFLAPRVGIGLATMGVALAPLRSPLRGGGAMLLALAKKSVEVAAILCVQRAFGLSLPIAGGILVLACLNLATLVPVVPGNVGVYEAAVVVAYTRLGISPEQALAIAVVQHLCYFVALALPGVWWVARGKTRAPSLG